MPVPADLGSSRAGLAGGAALADDPALVSFCERFPVRDAAIEALKQCAPSVRRIILDTFDASLGPDEEDFTRRVLGCVRRLSQRSGRRSIE